MSLPAFLQLSIPQAPAFLLTGHWIRRDHEILTESCVFQGTGSGLAEQEQGTLDGLTRHEKREQISAAMLEELETS